MSAFTDQIKADVDAIFLTDFAENITYTPAGGTSSTIKALITKNQLGKDHATPRQLATEIHVQISREDVATRPILGGDRIQIPGISPPLYVVGIVDESDPGMWHLLVK